MSEFCPLCTQPSGQHDTGCPCRPTDGFRPLTKAFPVPAWQCPVCGSVWAFWVDRCKVCGPKSISASTK